MKPKTLLLVFGGIGALMIYAQIRARASQAPTAVLNPQTGQNTTFLNSGIYNPLFNPGGSTNYMASFAGLLPATGWLGLNPSNSQSNGLPDPNSQGWTQAFTIH